MTQYDALATLSGVIRTSAASPRRLAAAVSVAGFVTISACGGDDAGGSDRSGLSAYVATLPASVVDDSDQVEISVGDIDRAAAAAGLERPDRGDHDGLRQFMTVLAGVPVEASGTRTATFVPFPSFVARSAGQLDEFEDELGFTMADVSWFVDRATPPATLTVFGGDFDPERLESAMGPADDGQWSVGPAEGELDMSDRSAARPIGESLHVGLDDDRLVVGRTKGAVDATLAVDEESLADHFIVGPLVDAIDVEDVYAATFFIGHSFAAMPPLTDAGLDADRIEELLEDALPAPFIGLAVGSGIDAEGEPILLLAYAHPIAAAAEVNADAIVRIVAEGRSLQTGQPWSERFTAVDVTVSDAHVVAARLSLVDDVPASIGYQLVVRRDGLASHR